MRQQALDIISGEIAELNKQLDYETLENVTEHTEIYGGNDSIDSLSLVMLVTAVETKVNADFDAQVLLASEKAMSMRNSPYRSVGALIDFIQQELEAS